MARIQDNPAALVVGTLITWGVSHLLVVEAGPGRILTRLREAVDATPLAGVLDCFGCTSIWVGAATGVALGGRRARVVDVALGGLAMSGAAFLLQKLITERETADWLSEPEVESPLITVHG
jgi:hypothetical protein